MEIAMKKAIRYTIVFFLSIEILVLLVYSPTAKAQQVTASASLSAGMSFTYGTPDGSPWAAMNPSSLALWKWSEFGNLSTISFRIINGTNKNAPQHPGYTLNTTVTFRNGTSPISAIGGIDLYTGGGAGTTFFISPGKKAGDYVYPDAVSSNYTWKINSTRLDTLYWPGRQICILNYTVRTPYLNSSSPLIVEQSLTYWDQQTGVLLGVFDEVAGYLMTTRNSFTGLLLYELIGNNIGIQMDYPHPLDMTPIYVVVAVCGAAVLGVVILRATVGKPKGKYKRLKE